MRRAMLAVLGVMLLLSTGLPEASSVSGAQHGPCQSEPGWTQLTTQAGPEPHFRTVAPVWNDPATLYAGGRDGLYHSSDCGQTWSSIAVVLDPPDRPRRTNEVNDVAVDRNGTVYLASYSDPLLYSQDAGTSWHATTVQTLSVSTSPIQERLLYAVQITQAQFNGVTRSDDDGNTWQSYFGGPAVGLVGIVAADPLDRAAAYLGYGFDERIGSREVPRGVLWRQWAPGREAVQRITMLDKPISGLALSVDGAQMWAATDAGSLLRSADGGESWLQVASRPYQGHLIKLAASPADPQVLFAVTADSQLWAYRADPTGGDLIALPSVPIPPWLVVIQAIPVYSTTDAYLGNAEPGEWYRVLQREFDWALVVRADDPSDAPMWIQLDSRVELVD